MPFKRLLGGKQQRESPIVVQEGEDITLSCSFEPERNLQLLNITWKKETAEGRDLLVHTYYNGRDQMLRQNKAYLGRTQLYPERFHEGIASLRLKNVQLADDGVYTCHVKPQLGTFSMRMRVTVEKGRAPLTGHRTSPRVRAAGPLGTAPRGGGFSHHRNPLGSGAGWLSEMVDGGPGDRW
uniref:Ig-like domain-containing protein n=1 Tax=Terrapene triunguis TaxID=2587831 RepID=A0A674JLZ0_9SAUR